MDGSIENLDGLIRKIQKEGVARAEADADRVLTRARQEAEGLLARARKQAEEIQAKARQSAAEEEARSRQALEQAARDCLLTVRDRLVAVMDRLLAEACRARLSGEALGVFLEKVALAWKPERQGQRLELWVSDEDRQRLLDTAVARLQEQLKDGVELRVHPDIRAGLRISRQGESVQYDFSDAAMAEVLGACVRRSFSHLFNTWIKETQNHD